MTIYNYHLLDDNEFEHLAVLVAAHSFNAKKYKVFGKGADGGVDGVIEIGSTKIAIQAKNRKSYPKADIIEDIENLDLENYDGLLVVVSSNPRPATVEQTELAFKSLVNKNEIDTNKDYFHWTGPQLDREIDCEPAVALPFAKIATRDSQLDRFHRNPQVMRGLQTLDEVKKDHTLAKTELVQEIADTLDLRGLCLVTGDPGIGKSTAALLAASEIIQRAENNGEPVPLLAVIEPNEGINQPIDTSQPIIYFFDDFMGPVSLTANAERGNLSEVHGLIRKTRSAKIYLILTSRSYLVSRYLSSRDEPDLLSAFRISEVEEIEIRHDTTRARAQILAALLRRRLEKHDNSRHTPEFEAFKSELVEDRNYLKILQSEHFNPRGIELALQRETILAPSTIPQMLDGMADVHGLFKDSYLTLTQAEIEFLREILVRDATYVSRFILREDNVAEYNGLLKALEGFWIVATEVRSSQPVRFQYNIANPSASEFLAQKFLGTKSELKATWDLAESLGSPEIIFRLLSLYLKNRPEYKCLGTEVCTLANQAESVPEEVWQAALGLGLETADQEIGKHALRLFDRWFDSGPDSLACRADDLLNMVKLTSEKNGLVVRSAQVDAYFRTARVLVEEIEELQGINEWILNEPCYRESLDWIRNEVEEQLRFLEYSIITDVDYVDEYTIFFHAKIIMKSAEIFGFQIDVNLDDLLKRHDRAWMDRYRLGRRRAKPHDRPSDVEPSIKEIHEIIESAFSDS